IAGLCIGTLVGMTGMGGGSLMTPMLIIVFGFQPVAAVGTDIAHGAIFQTVGAIRHRRLGNVQARLSGWMLVGSAPASLLGVFFGLSMLVLFPLRAHKVVGTDILHAAALLYVAGFGHFIAGNVHVGTVGWLLIGSIPGVLLGSQLTLSIPERPLRMMLACILGLGGLRLLKVP